MNQPLNYSSKYYEGIQSDSAPSARQVVRIVMELVRPQSIVDVGCGSGAWTRAFKEAGVEKALGIDGFYVKDEQLLIDPKDFRRADLTQPLNLSEKFDLAVSLEVAEHLPGARAASFVSDLSRLSSVIMFSAAVPGQGGTHHINEQWPSYWAEHFWRNDYALFDVIRPKIWRSPEVKWWFRQNILLFMHKSVVDRYAWALNYVRTDAPLDIVHPDAYETAALPAKMSPRMLKEVVRALPTFPAKIRAHMRK
jgi:SAM-dependent methyltransferase